MKSIRGKIVIGMIGTALLCFIVSSLLLRLELKNTGGVAAQATQPEKSELIKRGTAIAQTLGGAVLPPLLEQNTMAISELCSSIRVSDLVYIYVTDSAGQLVASSLGKKFPKGLESMNIPKDDSISVCPIKDVAGKSVYEIAFPLEGGIGAVHVGMNADAQHTVTASATSKGTSKIKGLLMAAALATLIITIISAFMIAKLVEAPIAQLNDVVKKICEGKLTPKIDAATASGAMGQLGRSLERLQAKLEVKIEE